MQIYPAIDLFNGQCVRLYQGEFNQMTHYRQDPVEQASYFAKAGATWLHLVDLNAAKGDAQNNQAIIQKITQQTALKIQIGGGVRSRKQIVKLFADGVERIIIGSHAINNPSEVICWLQEFGADRIVIALDVKIALDGFVYVAVQGWQQLTEFKIESIIDNYYKAGIKHVLCTDISRDGTLQGPNIQLYKKLLEQFPGLQIQASGGITCVSDIKQLSQKRLAGAVIGRALYESKISNQEIFGDFKFQ